MSVNDEIINEIKLIRKPNLNDPLFFNKLVEQEGQQSADEVISSLSDITMLFNKIDPVFLERLPLHHVKRLEPASKEILFLIDASHNYDQSKTSIDQIRNRANSFNRSPLLNFSELCEERRGVFIGTNTPKGFFDVTKKEVYCTLLGFFIWAVIMYLTGVLTTIFTGYSKIYESL